MKRWILALISIVMLLVLTACVSAPESKDPEVSVPEETYDLAYDMKNYDHFADIFDEKSADEWDAMGAYTILLRGLHTPVLVDMNGMDVLSVSAYDQTVELGTDGAMWLDEVCPISFSSTEETVVVNLYWETDGKTILITKDQCYTFQPENDYSTTVFVREDGTLGYHRNWCDFEMLYTQCDYQSLFFITSRDELLYETGHAEIVDGDVVLTAEKTVVLSDESDKYDLDAMFAEAKAAGAFEEYDSLDALLAANQARANQS